MIKYFYIVFLVVSIGAVTAQETALSKAEIVAFKENVKVVSTKTKTIESSFTQYKHLEFLSDDIKTLGKMMYKSPNLVKWTYTDPFKYSVIFKKDKILINNEGKKSDVNIGSSELFKKLNQLIVNSISGNMFNNNEFEISYHKTDGYYRVNFLFKDKDINTYIKQFVLKFNKKNYRVFEVKMIEPSDDYTQIIFDDQKVNQPIKDEVFTN